MKAVFMFFTKGRHSSDKKVGEGLMGLAAGPEFRLKPFIYSMLTIWGRVIAWNLPPYHPFRLLPIAVHFHNFFISIGYYPSWDYLGGNGSCSSLKEEIDSFGLSQKAKELLTSAVCGRKASLSCPMPWFAILSDLAMLQFLFKRVTT